jgi:hypothetical protein
VLLFNECYCCKHIFRCRLSPETSVYTLEYASPGRPEFRRDLFIFCYCLAVLLGSLCHILLKIPFFPFWFVDHNETMRLCEYTSELGLLCLLKNIVS